MAQAVLAGAIWLNLMCARARPCAKREGQELDGPTEKALADLLALFRKSLELVLHAEL